MPPLILQLPPGLFCRCLSPGDPVCQWRDTRDNSQPGSQEGTQQAALEASSAVSLRDGSLEVDGYVYTYFYFKYSETINLILNVAANKTGGYVRYTHIFFSFYQTFSCFSSLTYRRYTLGFCCFFKEFYSPTNQNPSYMDIYFKITGLYVNCFLLLDS